jgi:hypothetical protein
MEQTGLHEDRIQARSVNKNLKEELHRPKPLFQWRSVLRASGLLKL